MHKKGDSCVQCLGTRDIYSRHHQYCRNLWLFFLLNIKAGSFQVSPKDPSSQSSDGRDQPVLQCFEFLFKLTPSVSLSVRPPGFDPSK